MTFRQAMGGALEREMRRHLAPFRAEDWPASAVVVAPHPDDETLGCGGVICKKIAAGADVRFVFVTDGAASHRISGGPGALGRQRAEEALEAVRCLGAGPDRVTFLNVPDGRGAEHIAQITGALSGLLRAWRPQSVYVVHCGDPPADHRAVFAAVSAAIRAHGRPVTLFEYPIWYWYHWPWVGLSGDMPGMWRRNLGQTARTLAGLRSLSQLNVIADVSDVAEVKRAALRAHRSQTQRPEGRADWPVLGDLGRGDFLARLTRNYEAFLRSDVNVRGCGAVPAAPRREGDHAELHRVGRAVFGRARDPGRRGRGAEDHPPPGRPRDHPRDL